MNRTRWFVVVVLVTSSAMAFIPFHGTSHEIIALVNGFLAGKIWAEA